MTKAEQKAHLIAKINKESKCLAEALQARKAERIKATPYARNILLLAIGSLPKEQRDYWKQMLEAQDALYPVNRRAQIYKVMLKEIKLVQ